MRAAVFNACIQEIRNADPREDLVFFVRVDGMILKGAITHNSNLHYIKITDSAGRHVYVDVDDVRYIGPD